jgi:rhamnosyltransferase
MEINESSPPKVVVAIAVYNGITWLPEQFSSLLSQKNVNSTFCISVDPSCDKSEVFCSEKSDNFKDVIVLPYIGKFGSAAQNFFRLLRDVDLSNCDYVSLSDQDDIWLPTKLSRAISELHANNADAYSSNVTAFWPNGRQKLINKAQPQQPYDFMFESPGPGCTFVLSQKLALAIQEFLIKHQALYKDVALHDWFIYAFTRSRGFKWTIDHESHMLYRQHSSNVVGANVGVNAKFQRFKKARDGWLFNQAILISEVLGYATQKPIEKIKRFDFKDRVWLILNAGKLRRRLLDQFAFAFLVLIYIKK